MKPILATILFFFLFFSFPLLKVINGYLPDTVWLLTKYNWFIGLSIITLVGLLLSRKQLQKAFSAQLNSWEIAWGGLTLTYYFSVIWATNKVEALFAANTGLLLIITYILLKQFIFDGKKDSLYFLLKGILALSFFFVMHTAISIFLLRYNSILAFDAAQGLTQTYFNILSTLTGHKNTMSYALFLLLPFNIISWRSLNGWWKWLALATILLSLPIMLLLMTRSVYIATLLFLILITYINGKTIWTNLFGKRNIALLGLGGLGLLVIYFLTIGNLNALLSRMNVFQYIQSNSAGERIIMWEKSWEMIKDRPLVGVGGDNWKLLYPKNGINGLVRAEAGHKIFPHPHNEYIRTWSETGIFGILFLLAFHLLPILYGFKAIQKVKDQEKRFQISCLLASLTAWLVVLCFTSLRLRLDIQLLHFFQLITLFYLFEENEIELGLPRYSFSNISFKVILGVFTLFLLASVSTTSLKYGSEMKAKKVRKWMRQGEWTKVKQVSTNPNTTFNALWFNAHPIKYYEAYADFKKKDYTNALLNAKAALKANPNYYQAYDLIGEIYTVRKRYKQAKVFYLKAIAINTCYDQAYYHLAQNAFAVKKYKDTRLFAREITWRHDWRETMLTKARERK